MGVHRSGDCCAHPSATATIDIDFLKQNIDRRLLLSEISPESLMHDELEKMEPAERQSILDELAERPDLWDENEEVMYL